MLSSTGMHGINLGAGRDWLLLKDYLISLVKDHITLVISGLTMLSGGQGVSRVKGHLGGEGGGSGQFVVTGAKENSFLHNSPAHNEYSVQRNSVWRSSVDCKSSKLRIYGDENNALEETNSLATAQNIIRIKTQHIEMYSIEVLAFRYQENHGNLWKDTSLMRQTHQQMWVIPWCLVQNITPTAKSYRVSWHHHQERAPPPPTYSVILIQHLTAAARSVTTQQRLPTPIPGYIKTQQPVGFVLTLWQRRVSESVTGKMKVHIRKLATKTIKDVIGY